MNQSSASGIIDWSSFSIGKGNKVNFNNGSGATLNRVTGGDLSTIAGSLKATGSVYLINPQGVIVSNTGRVATGGTFVASSRDESDSDFLNGKRRFRGSSNGDVSNAGKITSANGDVALIGHAATNSGSISANNGTASVAAGNHVLLAPSGSNILISGGRGDATNSGTLSGAQAQISAAGGNVYALAGNNGGIVRATGTSTIDGHVWLTSGTGAVNVRGTVQASNADGTGGTVTGRAANIVVTGKVDASATQSHADGGTVSLIANNSTKLSGHLAAKGGTQGHGGFVETSGAHVKIADRAKVSTLGKVGLTGTWLVDPNDFTIAASGGDITGAALSTQLNSNNVTISSNDGSHAGNGDIFVNDAVSWSAPIGGGNNFTLSAVHDINVNASINGTYTNNDGGPLITLEAATGNINLAAPVTGLGITLNSGQAITETGSGAILTKTLAGTANGSVSLNNAGNHASYVSFSTNGHDFSLNDAVTAVVQSLNAGSGAVSISTLSGTGARNIALAGNLTGGAVTLSSRNDISQTAGAITATSLVMSANGNISLPNVNHVANFGGVSADNLLFNNDQRMSTRGIIDVGTGNLSISATNSEFNIKGTIKGGNVTLNVYGSLTESKTGMKVTGAIIASKLTGSAGSVSLLGPNIIESLDSFTSNSFTLYDYSDLELTGTNQVPMTTRSNGFSVAALGENHSILIDGALQGYGISLGATGTISEGAHGAITADTLGVGGSNVILGHDIQIANLSGEAADGDFKIRNNGALDVTFVSAPRVVSLGTTSGDINFDDESGVTASTLSLSAAGEIKQSAQRSVYHSIAVDLLNVTAGTGISILGRNNQIKKVGTRVTASGPNVIWGVGR